MATRMNPTTDRLVVPHKYIHVFEVEGRGVFPFDMLRYDCCYPLSSEDAGKMDDKVNRGKRRVTLCRCSSERDRNHVITYDRWRSFGWRVVTEDMK